MDNSKAILIGSGVIATGLVLSNPVTTAVITHKTREVMWDISYHLDPIDPAVVGGASIALVVAVCAALQRLRGRNNRWGATPDAISRKQGN